MGEDAFRTARAAGAALSYRAAGDLACELITTAACATRIKLGAYIGAATSGIRHTSAVSSAPWRFRLRV